MQVLFFISTFCVEFIWIFTLLALILQPLKNFTFKVVMRYLFLLIATALSSLFLVCSCKNSGDIPKADVVITEEGCIRFNGLITVDAANRDKVIELCKQMTAISLGDEGVIDFDIMESVSSPNRLMIYETWKDSAVFRKHVASAHVTSILPQIQQLCKVDGKEFAIKDIEDIDHEKPFRFNGLMTCEKREKYISIVKNVIDETLKKDEGVIEYDIYNSLTQPNKLLLLEIWENRMALIGHLNSTHFTKSRKKTQGLIIGKQYLSRMQER